MKNLIFIVWAAMALPSAYEGRVTAPEGMLDETLVVWGGGFGRTPDSQGKGTGRDHNPNAFSMWFAGGGIQGGAQYGRTDEFGYKAIENRTLVDDLHATVLHLMGVDHEKLTYRHNGRDFRLTDVAGSVIHEILVLPAANRAHSPWDIKTPTSMREAAFFRGKR